MIRLSFLILILIFCLINNSFSNQSEGEKLFVQKKCITCHVVGRGRFVGPDLWNVSDRYSKSDLIKWINNPENIYEKYGKKPYNQGYPPMPNMNVSTSESLKIISYLKSLKKNISKESTVSLKGKINNFSNDLNKEYEVNIESVMADKVLKSDLVKTKDGFFNIKDLKGNIAYRVKIFHDGIEYSTDKFYYMPDEMNKDIDLTVYDASQDKKSIKISSAHLVVSYDEDSDNLLFAEIYNVINISKEIYIGYNSRLEQARKIIQFSKFKNIENLAFPHRSQDTLLVEDDKIIESIPLPPGPRRIVFTYNKPMDFFNTKLEKNFINKIDLLTIIVPESKIKLKIKDLEFTKKMSQIDELSKESYMTYSLKDVNQGKKLTLIFNKNINQFLSPKIIVFLSFLFISFVIIYIILKKGLLRTKK